MTARAPLALAAAVAAAVLALAACTQPTPGESPDGPSARPAPAESLAVPPQPGPPRPGPPAAPGDSAFASEADYRQQRAQAVAALQAAVSTEATGADACVAVPYGERPCGGPTDWAVVSSSSSDVDRVRGLASRVAALDARANRQFERFSTCEVQLPPTVALRDGQCTAGG